MCYNVILRLKSTTKFKKFNFQSIKLMIYDLSHKSGITPLKSDWGKTIKFRY